MPPNMGPAEKSDSAKKQTKVQSQTHETICQRSSESEQSAKQEQTAKEFTGDVIAETQISRQRSSSMCVILKPFLNFA